MSPSDNELRALEFNLSRVVEGFFSEMYLNLFSSVVPEYAYGGENPYLFELDLENSHQVTMDNF